MGSHCALAPDPQSGRDEVLAAQPTDRALHDSSLTSPGLQPPSPGYQTASSPLNAVPVLLLQQEGSMAPCASAHGHKGQGAWPSLLPVRLLLPLEGIPSCDRDVGFFRKPSFMPPLHPCPCHLQVDQAPHRPSWEASTTLSCVIILMAEMTE